MACGGASEKASAPTVGSAGGSSASAVTSRGTSSDPGSSTAGASGASLRDFHNYLVTGERIDGEWSDPVYLNSSGFDPSLFHDEDGRKYLVNMLWDHRPGHNRFAGIVLQEYSPAERRLVGARHNIFKGTALGLTEAPHLYKRDGWYYLITAEGGTAWGHAVTMARSLSADRVVAGA